MNSCETLHCAFSPQSYAIKMASQIKRSTRGKLDIGEHLNESQLEHFSEEQLGQLLQLMEETTKPVNPENPLGDHPAAPK